MKKIIYYVAASLDGYIAGANDDISGFIYDGKGTDQYLQDLKSFNHVLMGRKTYEFGYLYGVKPGEASPTYSHMQQYIISDHLTFARQDKQVTILPVELAKIRELKQQADTDIYLCGGGKLAGWLLKNRLIDELRIKLNPVVIGSGTKLFDHISTSYALDLINQTSYDDGLILLHYRLKYKVLSTD